MTLIIPVLDLKNGEVVHAFRGDRERYRPLQTPLAADAKPESVIAGLLQTSNFSTIYLADLDGIIGSRPQVDLLCRLSERFTEVEFWLDAGWPPPQGRWINVIGSESMTLGEWEQLRAQAANWILSLDFYRGDFRGAVEILSDPRFWPANIIVMSLDHVGSASGPDLTRLAHFRQLAPDRNWIAAGGIRDDEDIAALRREHIHAALVATAIHQGRLTLGQKL